MLMWKHSVLVSTATAALALGVLSPCLSGAEDSARIALSGQVSSVEDGPMEGVLVSAKQDGSTVTTTVVSDEQGRYSFPSTKVAPGRYAIRTRAVGYDLDGPKAVEVAADKTATADLKLRKAKNVASQLTDAEWLASIPGTENQKNQLLGCTNCHTLERTLRSTHDAEEFMGVLERMASYANQSFPLHPQTRVSAPNLTRSRRFRVRRGRRRASSSRSTTFRAKPSSRTTSSSTPRGRCGSPISVNSSSAGWIPGPPRSPNTPCR